MTESRNNESLATDLALTSRAINYAIILAVYNAGRLYAILFYSSFRGMTESLENVRLAAKLSITYRAVGYLIISAVLGASRLHTIFFYRRLFLVAGLVDLDNIHIITSLVLTRTLL